MQTVDMTGQRFGLLTVLGIAESLRNGARWRVRCECGVERVIPGTRLRSGGTKSCGCATRTMIGRSRTTHGLSHTPTWESWKAMRHRCSNPNDSHYAGYGGRGIVVCDRWNTSFDAFLTDMGERPSPDMTIDRKDVNGNYEPGNCRWATASEQQRNRRKNRLLTYAGETMALAAWAERICLTPATLHQRLRNGWSLHKALTTPLDTRHSSRST